MLCQLKYSSLFNCNAAFQGIEFPENKPAAVTANSMLCYKQLNAKIVSGYVEYYCVKMQLFYLLVQIFIITILQHLCFPEALGYNGPWLGRGMFMHLDK